jgi:adenosine kinase
MPASFDIVGIGHAILDLFVANQVTDESLKQKGLIKGAMNLVDHPTATRLGVYATAAHPGGSVANSLVVAASIGSKATFWGSIGIDREGTAFDEGMEAAGVAFRQVGDGTDGTGRCIVHVTPDAERTMATYLGASQRIDPVQMMYPEIQQASLVMFDGYMLDKPETRATAFSAILHAHSAPAKPKVVTSLGDSSTARRNAATWNKFVAAGLIDVVFANAGEAQAFTGTQTIEDAIRHLRVQPATFFVTLGKDGAIVVSNDVITEIPASRIEKLVDTTGAGDAFAGGVIHGLSSGLSAVKAAEIGSKAAAEIIQQLGAHPTRSLKTLGLAA